jgi:hypothetical protein
MAHKKKIETWDFSDLYFRRSLEERQKEVELGIPLIRFLVEDLKVRFASILDRLYFIYSRAQKSTR